MARNASVQQVQAKRVSRSRLARAEVFTIGPRKALMEQLEARSAINRELVLRNKAPMRR